LLPTDGTSPPRQTLPRSRRILRREDFLRVQEGGVRITTRHLLILLAPRVSKTGSDTHEHEDETRLGIVASRKMGAAVRRNRAKRLVRETFRRNSNLFPPNVDLVVIVRSGIEALSQADVEAEIVGVASLLRKRASGKVATGRTDRGTSKART
jgi:ribonuclease P protein component